MKDIKFEKWKTRDYMSIDCIMLRAKRVQINGIQTFEHTTFLLWFFCNILKPQFYKIFLFLYYCWRKTVRFCGSILFIYFHVFNFYFARWWWSFYFGIVVVVIIIVWDMLKLNVSVCFMFLLFCFLWFFVVIVLMLKIVMKTF